MRPNTSNWRNDDSYDFYDTLPIEGLAWECLRRYVPYQKQYVGLVTDKAESLPLRPEAQQRWGLRFPRKARPFLSGATRGVVALGRPDGAAFDASTRLPALHLKFTCGQFHGGARRP